MSPAARPAGGPRPARSAVAFQAASRKPRGRRRRCSAREAFGRCPRGPTRRTAATPHTPPVCICAAAPSSQGEPGGGQPSPVGGYAPASLSRVVCDRRGGARAVPACVCVRAPGTPCGECGSVAWSLRVLDAFAAGATRPSPAGRHADARKSGERLHAAADGVRRLAAGGASPSAAAATHARAHARHHTRCDTATSRIPLASTSRRPLRCASPHLRTMGVRATRSTPAVALAEAALVQTRCVALHPHSHILRAWHGEGPPNPSNPTVMTNRETGFERPTLSNAHTPTHPHTDHLRENSARRGMGTGGGGQSQSQS